MGEYHVRNRKGKINMRTIVLVVSLLMTLGVAKAQEAFFMQDLSIEISEAQYDPPVSLKKTGDFLVLKVTIENDSREYTQRREEIYKTLNALVTAAEKTASIKLHSGEYPIDRTNYKITLEQGSKRADTSTADIFVKIPLKGNDDIPRLTEELRGFVSGVTITGRTELFPGEVGLSIVDPEQYRYELIERIAEDTKKVARIFDSTYKVSGLDKKMKTRRVSVTEIELYLNYSFEILPEEKAIISNK